MYADLWQTIERRAEMSHQAALIGRAMGAEGEIADLAETLDAARQAFDKALAAGPDVVSPEERTLRAALGLKEW